jgi:hypothetical protein
MMVALDAAYGQVLLWRRDVELKSDPDMPLRDSAAAGASQPGQLPLPEHPPALDRLG